VTRAVFGTAPAGECWRVHHASPLSGVYPGDRWPDSLKDGVRVAQKVAQAAVDRMGDEIPVPVLHGMAQQGIPAELMRGGENRATAEAQAAVFQGRLRQMGLPGVEPAPEPLPPHVAGSDTSLASAQALRPHLRNLNAKVYDAVALRGTEGATCDEVEVALDGRHQTISSRIRHLVQIGALVDSGRRRRTRSGRTARVYLTR
jgi:hypothetical protein